MLEVKCVEHCKGGLYVRVGDVEHRHGTVKMCVPVDIFECDVPASREYWYTFESQGLGCLVEHHNLVPAVSSGARWLFLVCLKLAAGCFNVGATDRRELLSDIGCVNDVRGSWVQSDSKVIRMVFVEFGLGCVEVGKARSFAFVQYGLNAYYHAFMISVPVECESATDIERR